MTDSPNEKKFMREKIVKPKETKGQKAGRFFCLILVAIILGIVAAVSFVVSMPLAKKYFAQETPSRSLPITIEKDDEPGMSPAFMETMESTAPEETLPEPETESCSVDEEDIREIVRDEMEQTSWDSEKIKGFNQVITEIAADVDTSIVTVSSVKQQVDWFDNPVESTGQYAGVILAVNPAEVVILCGEQAVNDADSLRVVFHDGTVAEGVVKQRDSVGEMAAISVNTGAIPAVTLGNIEAMTLGNSYSVKNGDLILAVGSPAGRVHSVKYGSVSFVARGVQTVDGQTRVFYTDIACNEEKGTFFLNLSGQLIGWATDEFQTEENTSETMILSISEYKGTLQKLGNGVEIPYFGIMGQEVSSAMQEEGIPTGIYITDSVSEGPAYLAGIQNGDILTKIQGEEILTIRDFQSKLESMQSGAEVLVTIERKGINTYKEIEYRVTIGAR